MNQYMTNDGKIINAPCRGYASKEAAAADRRKKKVAMVARLFTPWWSLVGFISNKAYDEYIADVEYLVTRALWRYVLKQMPARMSVKKVCVRLPRIERRAEGAEARMHQFAQLCYARGGLTREATLALQLDPVLQELLQFQLFTQSSGMLKPKARVGKRSWDWLLANLEDNEVKRVLVTNEAPSIHINRKPTTLSWRD